MSPQIQYISSKIFVITGSATIGFISPSVGSVEGEAQCRFPLPMR